MLWNSLPALPRCRSGNEGMCPAGCTVVTRVTALSLAPNRTQLTSGFDRSASRIQCVPPKASAYNPLMVSGEWVDRAIDFGKWAVAAIGGAMSPGALASMHEVASSADRVCAQCGHLGAAPFLKLPPHSQGRRYGSIAAQISCWPGQSGNRGIRLSHSERIAVLPQESQ